MHVEFVRLLNELRRGFITPLAIESFRALSRPIVSSDSDLPPTELFPMRHEVERANSTRLAALQSPPASYDARDSGSAAPDKRKAVLAGMIVPERVVLKKGAQVMLIKNVDDQRGLVNGAVGRVLGFFAVPRGKPEGVVRHVKLSEDGKSLVVRSEEKENAKPTTTSTTSTKAGGEKPKSGAANGELFPLVEFPTPMGRETVLVMRDEFRVEDNEGNVLARRVQASANSFYFPWLVLVPFLRVRPPPRGAIRFLSFLHGPFLSTRARARPYSALKSILARCLRRARVMSLCLALRLWRVSKSSGLIPRRCVAPHGPRFTIADTRDAGLRTSQSHRMEQVVGESHDMMLTTHYCIAARHA
jgi:ATP-dependent DNA helicase PIF1